MDEVTEEILAKTKNGDLVITSEPKTPRNPAFHRFMAALIAIAIENDPEDRWPDQEHAREALKIKSGMYKIRMMPDGRAVLKLDSTNFASMSEQKFRRVADRWRYIIATEVLGVDPAELLVAVDERAG